MFVRSAVAGVTVSVVSVCWYLRPTRRSLTADWGGGGVYVVISSIRHVCKVCCGWCDCVCGVCVLVPEAHTPLTDC